MQPKRSHRWKGLGRGDLDVGNSLSTSVLIPALSAPSDKGWGHFRGTNTPSGTQQLHCITPGAGEVSKARRRNKPGGAEEPMFPSGKVGRRRCKASNAFMNVTMMKTYDRMEKDHFGPLSLGQKSPLESVENFDGR